MSFKILFTICLSVSICLSHSSFAEEAKEEKKAEGGEEKEKKSVPEWTEVQANISTLSAKIQAKKENINHLIAEKRELPPNSPRIKGVIDEMIAEHKELETLTEEYDKQLIVFKYRFPERGAKENRKYTPAEVKPLDQMEKELNIDGRLNRNMQKMRSQYTPKKPKKETSGVGMVGSDVAADKKQAPIDDQKPAEPPQELKSIDETDNVIMKK